MRPGNNFTSTKLKLTGRTLSLGRAPSTREGRTFGTLHSQDDETRRDLIGIALLGSFAGIYRTIAWTIIRFAPSPVIL